MTAITRLDQIEILSNSEISVVGGGDGMPGYVPYTPSTPVNVAIWAVKVACYLGKLTSG